MTRHSRWACAAACIALTATHSLFGFPSSRLVYSRGDGAESCPDEQAIRRAVAARLGYDPFFPAADKTIVAQIVRDRESLRGHLQLVDQHGLVKGLREFKTVPTDCEELVAAMSLAISIAIDPTFQTPSPGPAKPSEERDVEQTPPPQEPDHLEPTSASPAPSVPTPAPAAHFEMRPALLAKASVGIAPDLAVGFAASLAVKRRNLSLALEGRRDLSASTSAPRDGQVSASLWVATIAPCVHPSALFVCAIGSLGSLRGEGANLRTPHVDYGLYAAAGARGAWKCPSMVLFSFGWSSICSPRWPASNWTSTAPPRGRRLRTPHSSGPASPRAFHDRFHRFDPI